EHSLATVEPSLGRISSDLARGLVWSALWNATRDGQLSVEKYLTIAQRHAPAESNNVLLVSVLANVAFAIDRYVPAQQQTHAWHSWIDTTWRQLGEAEPGSDAQVTWARALAAAAAHDDRYAAQIRSGLNDADSQDWNPKGADGDRLLADPELRWALWRALAATGHATTEDLDGELARDNTASGRTAHLRARMSIPGTQVKAGAWTQITGRDAPGEALAGEPALTNDQLDAVIDGFQAGSQPNDWKYVDDYFALLLPVWEGWSIELARRFVLGLFPHPGAGEITVGGDGVVSDTLLVRDAVLEKADRWLEQNNDSPAAVRRLVVEQRDHYARALRLRVMNASL
ncbi:MAG: hypothetical protein GX542_07045, partial [Rhodococcus sp.]|nr:hypothetical protein [Rhodococcus sp. (in: high G+C Gram-positive bacteria)]